jgi:hypothetical protein
VKAISCLRSSSVNRVAVGWEVKSVGLDLVVQAYQLEALNTSAHARSLTSPSSIKLCVNRLLRICPQVLIDYHTGAHHHSAQQITLPPKWAR